MIHLLLILYKLRVTSIYCSLTDFKKEPETTFEAAYSPVKNKYSDFNHIEKQYKDVGVLVSFKWLTFTPLYYLHLM